MEVLQICGKQLHSFIIRTIFSHYVKISFANHWKELFKTALLCGNVYYALKKWF